MDDRERQTFLELQMKLVEHTNKLKTVNCAASCLLPAMTISVTASIGLVSALCRTSTSLFKALGRCKYCQELCNSVAAILVNVSTFLMLPQVQQQIAVLANSGRRAALTAEELSSVPDTSRTYNTVGRA